MIDERTLESEINALQVPILKLLMQLHESIEIESEHYKLKICVEVNMEKSSSGTINKINISHKEIQIETQKDKINHD